MWVLVFGGIALGGAALLAWLGLRLWRKVGALLAELEALGNRAGDLADLASRIDTTPLEVSPRH